MSVTLRCLNCDSERLVKPARLHKKSIISCRDCGEIGHYGVLVEAAGMRLLADIQHKLAVLKAG
ncbi:hypothetical protein [Pseudomonas sp. BP8]|uniref:hypothetical protein n=1 Tax=Pseudomonas sp. BP8 TaxID=2817864 RepID=UPI001AE7A4AD|nr:hypothetical protein [Pseudomonas sp. BP8]MBP2262616.1 hypothetical protein [Pseudomonas sp. BP8]HDS1734665.1 hypothetical protein [Pseudomonas putida]